MSQDSHPQIKVFQTLKDTYLIFFQNIGTFLKIAAVPFLILAAVAAINTTPFMHQFILASKILMPLTLVVIESMIVVRIAPFVVNHEIPSGPWYQMNSKGRAMRVFIWDFLFTLFKMAGAFGTFLFLIPLIVWGPVAYMNIPGLFMFLFWIALFVLAILTLVRFSLYPIWIALGKRENPLAASFKITNGNFWRIIWTIFLTGMPIFLVMGISVKLSAYPSTFEMFINLMYHPHLFPGFTIVAWGTWGLLSLLLYITRSLIYKQLIGNKE